MQGLPTQSVFFGVALLVCIGSVFIFTRDDAERRYQAFAILGLASLVGAVFGRLVWLGFAPPHELEAAGKSLTAAIHPLRGGYASLGVVAGGAVAIASVLAVVDMSRWRRLLDDLVPGAFLGLAMARMGCLSNACDFGTPAEVPWAIAYPAGSRVWEFHVAAGRVAADAVRSAPVHPLPVYLAAATVAVVATALIGGRRRGWAPGGVAVVVALSYLVLRLFLEWLRDPVTTVQVTTWMNVNQLMAGAGVILVLAAWGLLRRAE